MNWLVTLSNEADIKKTIEVIESVGGKIDVRFPENMSIGDKIVIAVSGPTEFPQVLKQHLDNLIGVYPNSDLSID